MRSPGTLKLDGYHIFEKIRNGLGGGLLTAVDNDLSPLLITTGSDEAEMIVVQASVGDKNIRIFNCYGPQEIGQSQRPAAEQQHLINQFWVELEMEVLKAKEEGCLVLIELDANAKVGKNVEILNSSPKCSGVVTRERVTIERVEKSVIDFILCCEELASLLEEMVIDDKRTHVLTKFASAKGVIKKVESDHNVLHAKFTLNYKPKKVEVRREIFEFKNKEAQKKFFNVTNLSGRFGSCFDPARPAAQNINKFNKALDDTFHQCFKKYRIKSKNKEHKNKKDEEQNINEPLKEVTELKRIYQNSTCKLGRTIVKQRIENLEEDISIKISEKNAAQITDQMSQLNVGDGKFCSAGMWKVKSKLCPRPTDPPMAKKDVHGNLVTSPSQLKSLYLDTYKHRLRHRKMESKYEDVLCLKNQLWERRLEILKKKVTSPWTISNLNKVLKSLKNNQSRDPLGMISELFKPGIIGDELKASTLSIMNCVKIDMAVPSNMQLSDVTSIYKNKGSRLDLSSDRGIFILTVLRKILDKLTYFDKYPALDKSMSGSNIGARKNKNIRNHLFIIHGVINSVVQGEDNCIDIQVYDLQQAFDALWLEDCMLDLYDSLPESERDDKLALVYETNVNNLVAVNTGVGQTDRVSIPCNVQQGGGWGPME